MGRLIAVLLTAAAVAAVGKSPASVLKVVGQTALRQAEAGGFKLDAEPIGRRLDPGDELKVLPNGRAHVRLPLGSVALLRADTVLRFEEAGLQPQVALLEGEGLFAITRPLDRGWTLAVRTSAAMATSKAGAFVVYAEGDRSSRVRVLRGSVRVRAEGRSVLARKGQEVRVAYGREPSDARAFDPALVSTGSFAIGGELSGAELVLAPPPFTSH